MVAATFKLLVGDVVLKICTAESPNRIAFPAGTRMFPATCNDSVGFVVPIPTFPAKYALPVVVAPPEMVRPVVCVPLPIVVEARNMVDPVNVLVSERRVDEANRQLEVEYV